MGDEMKDDKGHGSNPRGEQNAGVEAALAKPNVWTDYRDYYRGDNYGSVYADLGDKRIGHLDFSGNNDAQEARIQHIETDPAYQRQGVATAMLDKLRGDYPKLNWGGTTPDGTALKRAYEKKK
jgi:GNAT superfamily N-acetyltransferase